jgi:cobalt-zinc-cadmium efflux system membrane fusion protein
MRGLRALWTPTEEKTIVEKKTILPVELVKGVDHTLSVPDQVLSSLGIRNGKIERIVAASVPTRTRPLVLPGSTALDDTRLSRVKVRFNARVVEIRKIRPHPDLPGTTAQNIEREILTGDLIKEGQTLAVLQSVEVANMKSTLVNAWVQLYFDQDILDRYEAATSVVPEILLDTAKRNVRGDQTAIASSYTTLRTWEFSVEELRDLRKEADELIRLRLESTKDKALRREEEAAWAVKKDTWMRVDLKAPQSGTLVERNVNVGEYVADNTLPLFQIADVDRILIIANPAEDELPALFKLQKEKGTITWTIKTVDLPPDGITAPVKEISYFIDPNQHTAVLKGFIDNPGGRVRAGQLAKAIIELPPSNNVVEIPIDALVEDGKQSVVFVQQDPKKMHFKLKRVIVTQRFDKTAYVLSDFTDLPAEKRTRKPEERELGLLEPEPLREGVRVITSGALELRAALEDKESEAGN